MTEDELDQIERSLGVSLPDDYRRIAQQYPIKFNAGRDELAIWDNAARLIERNREHREKDDWPQQLYFMGDDGAGWQYAIDLDGDPPHVVIVEFGDVSTASPALPESSDNSEPTGFGQWIHEYLSSLRDDGVDINADKWPPSESWTASIGCVVAGLIVLTIVIAIAIVVAQFVVRAFG